MLRRLAPSRWPLAALILALLALPARAAGQVTVEARAVNVGVNGALGALTAAVRQAICGCFSWSGVAQGAGGGALMSVGKQVTGTEFVGSGLIGRQINALGVSAIASAGMETPLYTFSIGPLTLELRPGSGRPPGVRVDVTDLAILGFGMLDGGTRLDWSSTLDAGAPVLLHTREKQVLGHDAHGFAFLGSIFVLERFSPADRRRLVAHEAIHVLQWDALRQLATHPTERVMLRRLPGVREAGSYLDMGLLAPASIFLIGSVIPYHRQPWEVEAYRLIGRAGPRGHPDARPGV